MITSTPSFGFGGPCCSTFESEDSKLLYFYLVKSLMGYSKRYFRKKAKENYENNKRLSELYHVEADPCESFSQFKRRRKSNFIS
jgi:hypothetical protein